MRLADGIRGISGKEIEEIPVETMRRLCGGAPPVHFFWTMETLCSMARCVAFTTGGPSWKVIFRFVWMFCTTKNVATIPKIKCTRTLTTKNQLIGALRAVRGRSRSSPESGRTVFLTTRLVGPLIPLRPR
jgi:hypothetical protein